MSLEFENNNPVYKALWNDMDLTEKVSSNIYTFFKKT